MKIIAKRRAFFKGEIIKIGQVLEIKGNTVPVWAKKIGKEETPVDAQPQQDVKQIELDVTQETETETETKDEIETETKDEEVIVAGDGGVHVVEEETPVEVDEFAGKTEKEILAILDELITKGIEKNIMLDDVETKTPVQQIIELRELLKEAK